MTAPLGFLGLFGDAINFIFNGTDSVAAGQHVGGPDEVWYLTKEHLKVTFLAIGLSLILAMPAGLLLGHRGRGEGFAIGLGNAGRALPELVVIAFMLAFAPGSWFGYPDVVIALSILGIPPILTNCFVGIRQVDRGAVEAARGMGMTDLEIVVRVELPLAVPTIMTGVRTAALNIVATAAIAPLAGVRTLGDYILQPNVYGDKGVLAGAMLIATLAILIELALAGLQRLLTPRGLALQRA
jgi:osmoprotectant transport system permease protein